MRILTDSTCDLPPDLIRRHQLHVIPIFIALGKESYRDTVELSSDEFYRRLPSLKNLPTTAAPSAGALEVIFQQFPGEDLLCLFLTQKFSGLYATAQQVAANLSAAQRRKIAVVETGQLSVGLGWQVLAAAEAAEAGHSFSEVLAAAEATRQRLKVYAMLDTLEYVRHGGRVNAFAATLGDLLRIKVNVELVDGEVNPLHKLRTRQRAMEKLVELTHALGPLERLAILHAHCPADAQALAERLAARPAPAPLIVQVSGVVATHVGPQALGIAAVRAKGPP